MMSVERFVWLVAAWISGSKKYVSVFVFKVKGQMHKQRKKQRNSQSISVTKKKVNQPQCVLHVNTFFHPETDDSAEATLARGT